MRCDHVILPPVEAERQRLRTRIEELKGEVGEGARQRADLRRELARLASARSAPSADRREQQREDDEDEGDSVELRPRHVLVPHVSPAAARSLREVPQRIAADALRSSAGLAAGDEHAWRGAKHMSRAHDVLTIRIGRTWRMLFRISEERLELIDLVHRRELDATVARLARK